MEPFFAALGTFFLKTGGIFIGLIFYILFFAVFCIDFAFHGIAWCFRMLGAIGTAILTGNNIREAIKENMDWKFFNNE